MSNHEASFSVEKISDRLRREGLRMTKKREGILHALFAATGPMTLQEIQSSAGLHASVTPDYATVFRTIQLMEKLRLVHKVNLQRSRTHYELSDPRKHYDHLVCRDCGDVVLIDIPCPIGDAEKTIARQYGFRDLSHSLEFFGVCSTCSK
jgi:Fe2+ or Zn2+ uptake regulation protein